MNKIFEILIRTGISVKLSTVHFILSFLLFSSLFAGEHPNLFISGTEAQEIKKSLNKYPLLKKSYEEIKKTVEGGIRDGIEVPQPGEAGGYEHERHKQNYREMQQAGILFSITGEEKYAQFIREMLFKYAELYPTLGAHPLSHNQAPGKLFHQMLNETVWLLYASQAYDCIYDWLTESDRDHIETNVFKVIIKWFIEENAHEFDRIHNHGTWSAASIGMIGYAIGDQNLVEMALYGTKKDGRGGFLKQLDLLFSPDGYYMEGPYYIRYALRPFFFFAEAIERNQPELKIYDYRNQILKKAYYSAVQTAYPNGVLPPINDASRTMDITAPGIVLSNALTYYRYGPDPNLLGISAAQDFVILNGAGLKLAKDFSSVNSPPEFNWKSVEFTDGYDGKQGGLGILRMGKGNYQSMLLMKYGVHGEGHGHFDKLHFTFFNQGREVIIDYGFARWINIEPKFGGRYLPENKSYAMQTIAHNTVVVDETTQNGGDRREADAVWGERHFFDASDANVQVMSAKSNRHFPGVRMQRTMFLIDDKRLDSPVVVDLYRLSSEKKHVYDYPIHFLGQPISTSFECTASTQQLVPMGNSAGYQHIWKEAETDVEGTISCTWLVGNRYYSLISAAGKGSQVFFGRIGANDPNFNLRSEPAIILRSHGQDYLFANVIEPHGYFNEAQEKSENARPNINAVKIMGYDNEGSVIEVLGRNNLKWRIMVSNGDASEAATHSVIFSDHHYEWTGNYLVDLNAD